MSGDKVVRRRVAPLKLVEAASLLAATAADVRRLLWLVLLATGVRKGEALALRWRAVDLDTGTMTVGASLQRRRTEAVTPSGRRGGGLVEQPPKTDASRRMLAVPASLVAALREHRRELAAARLAARVWVDPDLVFTTAVGTPLDPRNVNRWCQRVCERAGLARHVRVHDLRHASASFLLAQGADIGW